MTLRMIDGFDGYATADLAGRHYYPNSPEIQSVVARNSGQSVKCGTGVEYIRFSDSAPFTSSTGVIGFAFQKNGIGGGAICEINNSGGSIQASLYYTGSTLQIRRGTTVLATGAASFVSDVWYYIEWKFEIANSTVGENILNVDGGAYITLAAGADTQNTGSAEVQTFDLGHHALSAGYVYIDDVYVLDLEGSVNNDFLGDVIVETILPDAAGYQSDWDGSDGNKVNNNELVDEATPDGDTTYVEDDTVGGIDSYTYAALSQTPATIHAVAVNTVAKKTTANVRTIKQIARPVSTNYTGAEHTLSVSYANYQDIWETNPADAAAWEEADVNGSEFGVKVES